LDSTTAFMTMSGFRITTRVGHLDRLKRSMDVCLRCATLASESVLLIQITPIYLNLATTGPAQSMGRSLS
jgi:hypothetical protein